MGPRGTSLLDALIDFTDEELGKTSFPHCGTKSEFKLLYIIANLVQNLHEDATTSSLLPTLREVKRAMNRDTWHRSKKWTK